MAFIALPESATFRDAKGNVSRVSFYLSANTADANFPRNATLDAQAILTDIEALTNASFVSARGPYSQTWSVTQWGTVATYEDVEDKALMTFQALDGSFHRIQIPAPLSSMFKADGETVDTAVTAVKQLVADMTHATYKTVAPTTGTSLGAYTHGNIPYSVFLGGVRIRRKLHRKANILVLSPDLSGTEE